MNTQQNKKIQAGINYLRMLRAQSVPELAEDIGESEEHIKECIRAAREHRDKCNKPPEVHVVEPKLKIHYDLKTGERQAVERVDIEIMRDVIVHYGTEAEGEFTTMLPVKVSIKRHE